MPQQPSNENYSPLALIATLCAALLLFAVFFVGFLVAPLAILVVFYVGFAASDRSKRASGASYAPVEPKPRPEPAPRVETAEARLAREAAARRARGS